MKVARLRSPNNVPESSCSRRFLLAFSLVAALLAVFGLAFRWHAYQTQRLESASLETLQSRASAPNADVSAHYFLGRALAKRQRHTEAVESFSKGLRLLARHDDARLHARLNGALAESLVARGFDQEAVPYLKRALELDAGNVAAHMALGRILFHREQYEAAALEFQAVTQLEPRHAEAWYALGETYNAMRKPELAEAPLRKAVELAPNDIRYLQGLGDTFARRSRFAEAIVFFDRALRIDPQNRQVAGALARARALHARTPEEYREARKALLELDDAEPDNAFFLGQIGILDAQHGYFDEAEKRLERALALDPNYPQALYSLATVYRRQGRHKEAQEALERFQHQERLIRRVSALQKRLSSQPKNAALSLELARAFEEQGKYADAAAQLRRHVRVAPDDAEAKVLLRRLEQKYNLTRPAENRVLP